MVRHGFCETSASTGGFFIGTMNTTLQIIIIALTVLICAVVGMWHVGWFIKNYAVDGCIKSSLYQAEFTTAKGKTISRTPIDEWYALCMKEKGYGARVAATQ